MSTPPRVVTLVACAAAAACSHVQEHDEETTAHAAAHVERHGRQLVLDAAGQTSLAITDAPLAAVEHRDEVAAFARVIEDPAASFALRAPVAGTWRIAAGGPVPAIGAHVAANQDYGWIEARLGAVETADVEVRLGTARAELAAATASAQASTRELERERALNADDKAISDRALEEAIARAAGDTARQETARASVAAFERLLAGGNGGATTFPLRTAQLGEIVGIGAHPGETVDAGALLVRVTDLSRPMLAVELHAPTSAVLHSTTGRITRPFNEGEHGDGGADGASIPITYVADAAAVDVGSPVLTRLYRVDASASAERLRPGQTVHAWLPSGDATSTGFVVPSAAVVRLAGRAWVWTRTAPDAFERVELALDRPHDGGWFTTAEWARGARVVVVGAQALLSAELLAAEGRPESED